MTRWLLVLCDDYYNYHHHHTHQQHFRSILRCNALHPQRNTRRHQRIYYSGRVSSQRYKRIGVIVVLYAAEKWQFIHYCISNGSIAIIITIIIVLRQHHHLYHHYHMSSSSVSQSSWHISYLGAPHTMDMVYSDTWSKAYSRTTAAFPAPWTTADRKFRPSVSMYHCCLLMMLIMIIIITMMMIIVIRRNDHRWRHDYRHHHKYH